MTIEKTTTTTASAPGKILLAGGYLVLEQPNNGLVVAVGQRFYTTLRVTRRCLEESIETFTQEQRSTLSIVVSSPQFLQEWKYRYHFASNDNDKDSASSSLSSSFGRLELCNNQHCRNIFVEKTLEICALYLFDSLHEDTETQPVSWHITIAADNDFYSLLPHLSETENKNDDILSRVLALPSFLPAVHDGGKVYKTGLGSSACLVTSLVGALVLGNAEDPDTTKTLDSAKVRLVHNLAQICHCYAQGKVGSGFDVSAACFGTHVYQRFDKQIVNKFLELLTSQQTHKDALALQQELRDLVRDEKETLWDCVQRPLQWPDQLLQVTLADVQGGSESPSMAKRILAWKANANGDLVHWKQLALLNNEIVRLLQEIVAASTTWDDSLVEHLATTKASEWKDLCPLLFRLHQTFQECRSHFKAMGDAAGGVPTEPDEQTRLADATLECPGVVTALVPGAGGYDALATVYINRPSVRKSIATMWENWKECQVCPLTVQASTGETSGLRLETNPPEALTRNIV